MKFINLLTAGALVSAMASSVAVAATDTSNTRPISAAQKKQIEQIIHDYLVSNPEILLEASQALQQKQQRTMQMQAQAAIKENANQLFSDSFTLIGNPKGKVTLVEFFDYQCIHCKKMAPVITALMKQNPNLRIIYKEFPIFGKSSDSASRAALAAAMQGKYMAMHDALLKQENRLNDQIIMDAAKAIGLDISKFKTDMSSQSVSDALNANRELAEKLHLMGTPAFIVATTPDGKLKEGSSPAFIPGAASEEALQNLVKKESSGS